MKRRMEAEERERKIPPQLLREQMRAAVRVCRTARAAIMAIAARTA